MPTFIAEIKDEKDLANIFFQIKAKLGTYGCSLVDDRFKFNRTFVAYICQFAILYALIGAKIDLSSLYIFVFVSFTGTFAYRTYIFSQKLGFSRTASFIHSVGVLLPIWAIVLYSYLQARYRNAISKFNISVEETTIYHDKKNFFSNTLENSELAS